MTTRPKLGDLWFGRRRLEPLAAALERVAELLDSDPAEAAPTPGLASLTERVERLTTRLEERLGELAAERAHLLSVLGSMSEGVLVTDDAGRTVQVNPAWSRTLGVAGDVERTIELTRQAALQRMIADTLASGEGGEIELEVGPDPSRTVILTSSPLTDGAGVVVLARDLTPFLQVSEMRRDFVANVSHELKTPLSAIRGFAETLKDGALQEPEAADRFTRRILEQCRRLEALLSDLLTLSRLEHPTAVSGWTAIDLRAIVEEAVKLTRDAATGRDLDISCDLEPVPVFDGDADALQRLSTNLLENAIKYNRPRGRVDVRLSARGGTAVLEIADTGIGIPPGSLERLFERFYRVDKGRSREEGGTGLGLAIVKHAAQLHGGKVEVESELGRGSTFRVLLPLAERPVAVL